MTGLPRLSGLSMKSGRSVGRQLARSAVIGLVVALAGCGSTPPAPDWQIQARDANLRATAAYLAGHDRVAVAEFARARREAARSARPDALARVLLAQCAAHAAALSVTDCEAVLPLQADMGVPQQAYWRYLKGQPVAGDAEALPAAQQAVARLLLAGATQADPAAALPTGDALSRLVAAAVLLRSGHGSPAVVAAGVDAAAEQGWTRPLLAWLGWQLRQAQAQGDAELARHTQRRLDVLMWSEKNK